MGNNAVTRSAGATTHMCTDFFARLFQRERQGSKIIPQEKGGYTVGENGGKCLIKLKVGISTFDATKKSEFISILLLRKS